MIYSLRNFQVYNKVYTLYVIYIYKVYNKVYTLYNNQYILYIGFVSFNCGSSLISNSKFLVEPLGFSVYKIHHLWTQFSSLFSDLDILAFFFSWLIALWGLKGLGWIGVVRMGTLVLFLVNVLPLSIMWAVGLSYVCPLLDFPSGLSDKEPACQCRRRKRCRFYPWVGKISWRRAWQPTPVFLPEKSRG